VKLWAAAHDINDASRSTFNSTSLLYLTVFFLQTQQLAPSFKELVDAALLNDPARRLLCAPNK
jgi:DNA polymerase sigma